MGYGRTPLRVDFARVGPLNDSLTPEATLRLDFIKKFL